MAEERAQRRLAAILAADVVGYSRLMSEDEAGTLAALKAHRGELIDPKITEHQGRIVKTTGDGMLVEFPSVVRAVQCAVEVQKGMAERNADSPDNRKMLLRIGINVGDVIIEGEDIYGDGVNVAARLEGLAEPGGICVRRAVRNQVRDKLPFIFEDLGELEVKNIARPLRVFRVAIEPIDIKCTDAAPALTLPDKPSIAVLPFDNMSGDPEQGYFSDGISEDIITDLSKISGLFVIARNSSFIYKEKSPNIAQVSRELGVRYVLEGSVRKAANRVRISAQLIDGTTGGHVWAERYDRELQDIFVVQDEVTKEIVNSLKVNLTRREQQAERKGTENLEAYDCYLRGREQLWQLDREIQGQSRAMLQRAIELDPEFAAACSMLSLSYTLEYINRWSDSPERSQVLARELAQKAMALDDSHAMPHVVMSLAYIWTRRENRSIVEATVEAEKAIALDPNSAFAYSVYAQALLYGGRSAEALEAIETAMRLDPHYPDLWLHFLGQIYFMLERFEEAVSALQRRLIRYPGTDISRVLLASCYGHLGRINEARAVWLEVFRINPHYSLDHHLEVLPHEDTADLDRMVDGLRKAGLPEHS